MEYASFLAGERWSDRPACTDPVLGELARTVNDTVTSEIRDTLIPEIPRVIGLVGDDRVSLTVGLRVVATAIPLVPADRQRALAVSATGMIGALRRRGLTDSPVVETARAALAAAPEAKAWGEEYFRRVGKDAMQLVVTGCSQAIRTAVRATKDSVADADERLADLLRTAIGDVEALLGRTQPAERAAVRLSERDLAPVE